ncbi:unnamed protein product, partial [Laminaria digitata]
VARRGVGGGGGGGNGGVVAGEAPPAPAAAREQRVGRPVEATRSLAGENDEGGGRGGRGDRDAAVDTDALSQSPRRLPRLTQSGGRAFFSCGGEGGRSGSHRRPGTGVDAGVAGAAGVNVG